MIPNTTPTPNELYNGEMAKMSDTELRVVLVITRATFGWEIDKKTGMRKLEDWVSHTQLIKKTGRSSRSVSLAINSCVKRGWIETRNQKGDILKTTEERKLLGKKIFYRLGKIFLDKTITIVNNTMVDEDTIVNNAMVGKETIVKTTMVKDKTIVKTTMVKDKTIANTTMVPSHLTTPTIALNDMEPSQNLRTTKETFTKENLTKEMLPTEALGSAQKTKELVTIKNPITKKREWEDYGVNGKEINQLFSIIGRINEHVNYGHIGQRKAAAELIHVHGFENAKKIAEAAVAVSNEPFAPVITTPFQLLNKYAQLKQFITKESNKGGQIIMGSDFSKS